MAERLPEGQGGGGYSLVACISHMTNDHASLSRWSTVPTHDRDTHLQHLGAHYAFPTYYIKNWVCLSCLRLGTGGWGAQQQNSIQQWRTRAKVLCENISVVIVLV